MCIFISIDKAIAQWRKHDAELKRIENTNKRIAQQLEEKENQARKEKQKSELNVSRKSYYDTQNAKTDQEMQRMFCCTAQYNLEYYFY